MRRYRDYRNSFAAGVLSKEALARSNDEVTAQALQEGRNVFIASSETAMRRCGSLRLARLLNPGRLVTWSRKTDGAICHAVFADSEVRFYVGSTPDGIVFGAPWDSVTVWTMAIVIDEERLHVFSRSFFPRTIAKAPTGWAASNFAFRVDGSGRLLAPFYRFGLPGVTILPSAYSGSVTLTFSAAVLTSQHVGVRFTYMRNQIRIDSVTNAQTATATVIGSLYPTLRLTVGNPAAYKLGEIVEGDVTNTSGQVAAIGVSTIDVILTDGYTPFLAKAGDTPGEKLIGSEGSQEITALSTLGAPAATNIWHEELVSAARGYPATAVLHRARLCMAGFPQAVSLLSASARGAFDDYDLGSGSDRDAILEFVGKDMNPAVKHLASTEQLLILTDRGIWYVPEGGQTSFTPRGIDFDPVSPDPCSDIPPVFTPEGLVLLDRENRVLLLTLTGTQQGAWGIADISTLNPELIKTPRQIAYSSGIGGRKERAIVIVNTDGTLAVFTYRRNGEQGGWVEWRRGGADTYVSTSAHNGALYFIAACQGFPMLEEASFAAVLDSEFLPSSTAYASETVQMLLGRHVIGDNATNASGVLGSIAPLVAIDKVGRDFDVRFAPAPLVVSEIGRQVRRAAKSYIDVIDTGNFRLNGRICTGARYNSDPEAPPPVNDREEKGGKIGSSLTGTILIEQRLGEGAPLHVRSVTMKQAAR